MHCTYYYSNYYNNRLLILFSTVQINLYTFLYNIHNSLVSSFTFSIKGSGVEED